MTAHLRVWIGHGQIPARQGAGPQAHARGSAALVARVRGSRKLSLNTSDRATPRNGETAPGVEMSLDAAS